MDTIDDNTAMQVGDLATSKEVYNDAIIRIYEGTNTDSTAFYTCVEMMDITWDGSSPISDHIAKIHACEHRLAVKRPVDSAITAYLLLHSLPSDNSWSSFTVSVLNSLPPDIQLTFATVETCLLAEAARVMSSKFKHTS